jgi:uncharacterized membrane protein
MVVLGKLAPGRQPLPFMTPDALYAICRYDLTNDPVAISAPLPDAGWALSIHSPQGDNFYAMPGQPQQTSDVSVVLVPGLDRASEIIPAARRPATPDSQIASPSNEGLIVIRAPLRGLAWRGEIEAALQRATCAPAKRS